MSWSHFQWARRQKTGCDRTNHVLAHLAYLADKNGIVVVSINALAEQLEMKSRTVQRALAKLTDEKFIRKERRVDKRGYRTADRFVIQRATLAPRNSRKLHPPKCQNTGLGQDANVAPPLTTTVVSTMRVDTFMDTYPLGETVVGRGHTRGGRLQ